MTAPTTNIYSPSLPLQTSKAKEQKLMVSQRKPWRARRVVPMCFFCASFNSSTRMHKIYDQNYNNIHYPACNRCWIPLKNNPELANKAIVEQLQKILASLPKQAQ